MKKIAKIADGGFDPASRRKLNEVIEALESLRILRHPDLDIDRTSQGTFIRPKGGGDNTNNNQAPRWG